MRESAMRLRERIKAVKSKNMISFDSPSLPSSAAHFPKKKEHLIYIIFELEFKPFRVKCKYPFHISELYTYKIRVMVVIHSMLCIHSYASLLLYHYMMIIYIMSICMSMVVYDVNDYIITVLQLSMILCFSLTPTPSSLLHTHTHIQLIQRHIMQKSSP